MEKIGIVTFHRADNYGAVLQSYASQTYLENMGCSVQIVDYRFPQMEQSYKLFRKKNGMSKVQYLKVIAHDLFRIKRRLAFEKFRKDNLKLSKVYNSSSICSSNEKFSIFITGSDQVWNDTCSLKDPVYCLTFAEQSKKLLSFAASFGYADVEKDRETFYANALAKMTDISIREKSGIKLVEKLIGKTPDQIPDPTLMLDIESWNKVASFPKEKGYILIYLLNARDDILNFAKKLSAKTGLKIVNITDDNRNRIGAKCVHNAGPAEFLGYFNNAKYVITNSFHGLMFSIIYRKSMYVDIPKGSRTTYERLTNILDELGIHDRYIDDLPENFKPQELDYSEIEEKIRILQNKTNTFFARNLMTE